MCLLTIRIPRIRFVPRGRPHRDQLSADQSADFLYMLSWPKIGAWKSETARHS